MVRRIAVALAAVSVVLAAGCGPTNSPVTVQGKTLQPQSSLMFNILFPGLKGTVVAISDDPDLCGSVQTDACADSPFAGSGSSILLIVPSTDPGEFQVGDGEDFSTASFSFSVQENGRTTLDLDATSGTITLEASELAKHASGSYDVTLEDGTKLQGTFAGEYCKKLEEYDFSGGMSCSWSSSLTNCSGSCSCEQKQVSASCTRSDEMADWACTCTNASGVQSSCSMPASNGGSEACGEGTSCCPYEF